MKNILLKLADTLGLFPFFNLYTRNTATVFMMHKFIPNGLESDSDISPGRLVEFFEYMKKHRYSVIPLTNYVDNLKQRVQTYKTVVFTVDDGYRDFYQYAYPVFKEYHYPATIFITSDFIDEKIFFWWDALDFLFYSRDEFQLDLGFMGQGVVTVNSFNRQKYYLVVENNCKLLSNKERLKLVKEIVQQSGIDVSGQPSGKYAPLEWKEILEMQNHGMEFYPHTKTHPILTQIPIEERRVELEISKSRIEKMAGHPADIFSYPNGRESDFNEDTIHMLKGLGYIAAVTSVSGFDLTNRETDMFRLHRYSIPANRLWFKQYISGLEYFKRNVIHI